MSVSKTVALPLGYTHKKLLERFYMTQYSLFKDYKTRQTLKKKQKNLILLKAFILNEQNSKKNRFKIMLKMDRFYADLKHNAKTRCIFSTKTRSVSRMTNLTKASFKNTLTWANASGFKKSSW